MIIDCIADLHGHYPKLEGGDLLIVAGDLTARDDLIGYIKFDNWLQNQSYKKKIFISGNHDNGLKDYSTHLNYLRQHIDVEYLCDSGTEFEGLKIWGSPWTLKFDGMNPRRAAFTGTEADLKAKFDLIPIDTDILITHGPPYGIRDQVLDWDNETLCVGSRELMMRVQTELNLKLLVFGHIHDAYGTEESGFSDENGKKTTFVNCCHVNENYEPVNKPVRIEI